MSPVLTERAVDLEAFKRTKDVGHSLPFSPLTLAHIYIKLDFTLQYENARTAEDARGFLRSVARASLAAHLLAERWQGVLIEVQGSMLHVVLPLSANLMDFVGDLHWAYKGIFNRPDSRVSSWCMSADMGKTLVVAGRGVHGDDSWVSLGRAANRPAKHLYSQLELPRDRRDLKPFWIACRDPQTGTWRHTSLDSLQRRLEEVKAIAEVARTTEPNLEFVTAGALRMTARALPIAPAGMPSAPSADRPHTYFGWVMRCDLDGFTGRVDECFDNDQKLQHLAVQFYTIMDAAAQFTSRHSETLAQLPWAGDNFTAAAVFAAREDYDQAARFRLVELSLDFDKEMAEAAVDGGFAGWAHGIAGGEVHGNANGNVYLGSVVVGGRRFLVGAGEGFGRSSQAFADINPEAQDVVIFEPDWKRLDDSYRRAFEPAINSRGEQSTLYLLAKARGLLRGRAQTEAVAKTTTVTFAPFRREEIAIKPHYQ